MQGQKGPLLSQQCDLCGRAGCQKWAFCAQHSSLGGEREQLGVRAQVPLGGRAGGQAGDSSTVGVAELYSDGKRRMGGPSQLLSTHARVSVIREPQLSAQHFTGLTRLVVLRGSLILSSRASPRPQPESHVDTD